MSSVDDTLSSPAQLGGVGLNRWVEGGTVAVVGGGWMCREGGLEGGGGWNERMFD